MNTASLFTLADEAVRMAEKLRNGANIHEWTNATAAVRMFQHSVTEMELMASFGDDEADALLPKCQEGLLLAINALRKLTLDTHHSRAMMRV